MREVLEVEDEARSKVNTAGMKKMMVLMTTLIAPVIKLTDFLLWER